MSTTLRLPDMAAFEALKNRDTKRIDNRLKEMPPPPPLPPVRGAVRNPRGRHEPGKMNKSELAYSYDLDLRKKAGDVKDWKFESVKMKLADNCFYTPDFNVEMANGDLVMVDVKKLWKGKKSPHYEDDSRVKIKVCAEMFRKWFNFYGVHWDGEKWVYESF